MILFEVVIVIIGVGAELQLLHLDDVLFTFRLVLFLFVLVLPLPVVHRFCDGWLSRGSNQDQIETHILGFANSLGSGQNFYGAIGKNGANFAGANRLIDVFTNSGTAGWKSSRNHRHIGLETAGETIMT